LDTNILEKQAGVATNKGVFDDC